MSDIPETTLLSPEWKSLQPSTRCVYLVLLWQYKQNKAENSYLVSGLQVELAHHAGVSLRTVKRAIKELRTNKWIAIVKTNDSCDGRGYAYDINPKYADGENLAIQEMFPFLNKANPSKWKGQNTAHWREIRVHVLIRDGYKCTTCGSGENLVVHHLTYENAGQEKMDDLITLCSVCHRATMGNR